MTAGAPTIAAIQALQASLAGDITRTPMLRCAGLEAHIGADVRIWAKPEFLQRTGTFKARGALAVVKSLTPQQIKAGVTAVSAGNHAIATAYAAKAVGASAKSFSPTMCTRPSGLPKTFANKKAATSFTRMRAPKSPLAPGRSGSRSARTAMNLMPSWSR